MKETSKKLNKKVEHGVDHECFLDPDFPRNAQCLIDDDDEVDHNSLWQSYPDYVEWIRAKDIPSLNDHGEAQIFTDGIEPGDVL